MTTFQPWRTVAVLAASWLVGWGAVTANAAEIRDNAKFFSPEVVQKATNDLKQLEKQSRIEVQIETHETVPADKQAAFGQLQSKTERDKFFADWILERVKAENAKGVFVLITRQPGHLNVELANSLRSRGFGTPLRNELRDTLVKNFKVEQFDEGLKQTVSRLETIALRVKESPSRAVAAAAPRDAHRAAEGGAPVRGGNNMGIWGWVILGVVVWIVFAVVSALIRGISGGNRGYGPGYGQPGYGQPGYGQPGYGQPGYGGYGGGGGFFSNMLGGVAGAMAGNWLYNSMSGGSHSNQAHAGDWGGSHDNSSASDGGADFGGSDFGGGDFGGGDFGGGDWGGGDFGGGGGDF